MRSKVAGDYESIYRSHTIGEIAKELLEGLPTSIADVSRQMKISELNEPQGQ